MGDRTVNALLALAAVLVSGVICCWMAEAPALIASIGLTHG